MSAIRELVQSEIDRLRKEGECLKQQAKALMQRADALEHELETIHKASSPTDLDVFAARAIERGGRSDAIISLLDEHPDRTFNIDLMQKELGVRVDPSLVSRLKREGKIAKARTGGYCSLKSSPLMKDDDAAEFAPLQEELVG